MNARIALTSPTRRTAKNSWAAGLILGALLCAASLAPALAAEPTDAERLFETTIHPLLTQRCFKCHHGDKAKGELRLDSLAAMHLGGESGPAVVPGKPDESLLIEAIQYESFEMPPDGQLSADEIAAFTRWIELGAPWPGQKAEAAQPAAPREKFTAEDRAWWAFQPLADVAPPKSNAPWVRNDIDRFVLARLESAGLTPAPEADRRTLIRRLYFDLIGLPPTPDKIEAFVHDPAPDAYEALVDRLLASRRYGERQAQTWLDLVRYAESDGFRQDAYRPQAWRYRDWVVQALNDDLPYDQFVTQQLAGDELAAETPDAAVATGFYRLGIYEYNQRDAVTQRQDMLNDITDVAGEVFLGLGFGCAKCHDHKFDPILQEDYYRLQAFFAPMVFRDDVPVAPPPDYAKRLAAWESRTAKLRRQIAAIETPHRAAAGKRAVEMFPPDIQAIYRKPAAERNSYEEQLADLVHRQTLTPEMGFETRITGAEKQKWEKLKQKFAPLEAERPQTPLTLGVADFRGPLVEQTIPGKRNATPIAPGFLTLLDPAPATIEPPADRESTGRRLALARWITRPDNPLSTRVVVNRLWQQHFDCGLVATSSDFGRLGEEPSHPELLDWLARRLVAEKWSLKAMHRLMVTSATYRQSSLRSTPAVAAQVDPQNRLLWRMGVRRLDAEAIRDALLAVTGELDLTRGGPSVTMHAPRRSIYLQSLRNTREPLLDAFDLAERITSTPRRNVTTTPVQSLLMINNRWTLDRAAQLAARLRTEESQSPEKIVDQAYQLAFGRPPTTAERDAAAAFLNDHAPYRLAARPLDKWVRPFPGRTGTAMQVQRGGGPDQLRAPNWKVLPEGDFTVEAFVRLDSLYPDASVRTIAAQWDGNVGHPGWSFGVTSAKSRYLPQSLILQLVGDLEQGGAGYEVVASDLKLELNRPYYVAIRVRAQETGPAGVTFYVQELDGQRESHVAQAAHRVTGHYRSSRALTLGGRDHAEPRHRWHGLLDDVRVTAAALAQDELLIGAHPAEQNVVGFWRFEPDAVLKNAQGPAADLQPPSLPSLQRFDKSALVDFCHVLLNSNEFLYVD